MGIRICLDEVLKKKGMTSKELCRQAYDESYLLFPSM